MPVTAEKLIDGTTDEMPPDRVRIGGRYQVEDALAQGGMGAVYRVLDTSNGQHLALKRLRSDREQLAGGAKAAAAAALAFEQEFHTLKHLQHPSIIAVHDYGTDESGPYYTMELLDGRDLRELAPLDYRQACNYLRDVSSSLALLHARRLVHRDVSPRNIRVTSDGHCKLIDFGALTGFGKPPDVVGTPSCMAPEALHRALIDQRTDIYALGAVAYWLLTGRQAYPARDLHQVLDAWQRTPTRPSEALSQLKASAGLPAIPPELDTLVMAMLSRDPRARPASMAVVISRLTVIASLEPLQDLALAQSYLTHPELVGRRFELERIQEVLERLQRGRGGGSVVISGASGLGKSRLLQEGMLTAQLSGATLVQTETTGESESLARQLAMSLLDQLPELAVSAARPYGEVLARFVPQLAQRLGIRVAASRPDAAGEWRMQLQSALEGWIGEISRQHSLVIAVDDLHRADAFSTSLVATLAHAAPRAGFVLLAATDSKVVGQVAPAIELATSLSSHILLTPLDNGHTVALVRGLFGDVANTTRLGERLHALTGGSPLHLMGLARHLVDCGIIRFHEGAWLLPSEIDDHELPLDLEGLWQLRIADLDPAARALASALSLVVGPASRGRCEVLHDIVAPDASRATGSANAALANALDALVAHDILRWTEKGFAFTQEACRRSLEAQLDVVTRQRVHRACAERLLHREARHAATDLDAGWHLLRAGDEERGANLLAQAAFALAYDSDDMITAMPAFEAALDVYAKLRRSRYERLTLLVSLCMGGYALDRRYAERHANEAIRVGRLVAGLDVAERLRPWLGRRLALFTGLGVAALRYLRTPKLRRPQSLRDYITSTVTLVVALAGTATIERNVARARELTLLLEPFRALGERHTSNHSYHYCKALSQTIDGNETEGLAAWHHVRARLEDPNDLSDLPSGARAMSLGGALYAAGVLESFRAGDGALRNAEKLESLGLKLYNMIAAQLRTLYHAQRGELALAEQWLRRLELHAVQRGSAWQVEVWGPSALSASFARCDDLLGLKQAVEQWQRVVQQLPGLRPAYTIMLARYHMLRGELATAISLMESAPAAFEARNFIAWAANRATLAHALNRAGEHARARDLMLECIAEIRDGDLDFAHLYLQPYVELAMAEAGLGQHAEAAARLDMLIATYEQSEANIIPGGLHEARAKVAMAMHDADAFHHHMTRAQEHYEVIGTSGLLHRCRQLREDGQRLFGTVAQESTGTRWSEAFDALEACEDPHERAQGVLDLILRESQTRTGTLYVVEEGALQRMAPRKGTEDASIRAEVERTLATLIAEDDVTVAGDLTSTAIPLLKEVTFTQSTLVFRVLPLWALRDGELKVSAAIVLGADAEAPLHVPHELLQRAGDLLGR